MEPFRFHLFVCTQQKPEGVTSCPASGSFAVLEEFDRVAWHPESTLATMSPFVREMHTKNGLLERVRASRQSVEEIELDALSLLTRHVGFREGVLAGNSIHSDRRFLVRYMPAFERFLHYRQLDVSSLKVLAQAWYGNSLRMEKRKTHDALDDIRESLAELRHYARHMLAGAPRELDLPS